MTTSHTLIELPLASYPGASQYALDLVNGEERATRYSSRRDGTSLTPPNPRVDRAPIAAALRRANEAWGNDVGEEVDRWSRGESVTIVGGQQVGFAGGPLLTLSKIASILRIKRDLERSGTNAAAMFWMATEDHDFGEVALLDWPRKTGGLATFRCPHPPTLNRPVGPLPIPSLLIKHFHETTGIDHPEWLRDGVTFRDSFAELVATAFRGQGLILVDSMEPTLRAAGVSLFTQIAESVDEVERLVNERSRELQDDGYGAQVSPNSENHYSLLYFIRGSDRVPARRVEGGWSIDGETLTSAQMTRLIESEPETVSTGALARPLLQDFVLQPSFFVGGPAEVSYYSQITPLHALFGIDPPHVALRGHVLVAPEKILRAMEKYDVAPPELISPPEEILSRREQDEIRKLHDQVARLAMDIDEAAKPIRETVAAADPAMERSLSRTLRRIRYHVGKLDERGGRAILRRDAERHRAVHRLCGTLFPSGVPQDRRAAWVGLWDAYRDALVDPMIDVIEPDSATFHIMGV